MTGLAALVGFSVFGDPSGAAFPLLVAALVLAALAAALELLTMLIHDARLARMLALTAAHRARAQQSGETLLAIELAA